MSSQDVLKSASTLASYNVLLQVMFRALTFLLNVFTLRFVSKELIGVVNLVYTGFLVLCYIVYFLCFLGYGEANRKFFHLQRVADLLPSRVEGEQSFLKQILTEGERYVMTFLNVLSFREQSVYDIVNNLGSMIAIPIAAEVLECLLKLVLVIGLIITVSYVLLLAINGVTECFVFTAMTALLSVPMYNLVMLPLSISFLLLSYMLTWWAGGICFTLANCLNMGLRIILSLLYFLSSQWMPLRGLRPSSFVLLALALSAVFPALSEGVFCCDGGWLLSLVHIAVGTGCLLSVFVAVLLTETKLVQFVKNELLPQYGKKYS
uniref:Protein RFT1 homolog n=1 Tax=Salmo trutta TaxID=8032 RepID=A0A673ZLK7_SALTR